MINAVVIVLLSIASLIALLLQSWLAATVVRRVVGVPVGWPRSIAVGFVMSAALGVTVQYLFRAANLENGKGLNVSPPVATMFLVLAVCWIFALGVVVLVALEAAFPTGTLPSPAAWFTGWGARRRRAGRYRDVVSIAVRHGLGSRLRGFRREGDPGRDVKTARALRDALNEAGVTFIKLGQMLSTRRDLLPAIYVRELATLQTSAAPETWEKIEAVILASLGRPLEQVFRSVNPVPLAAASVAQVHEATLLDGTAVVVKVQRPSALDQVTLDSDIIVRLARWLNKTTLWGRTLGVHTLARGFVASLEEELDYTVERDNMRSIEHALASSGKFAVTVPHAYPALSGERLLVMDRLQGLPVGSAGRILASMGREERSALASTLLGVTLQQIISDGVFHADLHPGNIFITPEGTLGLLDFGSVGRLDPGTQEALGMILYAMDKNDSAGATNALIDMLERPERLDERALERSLGQLLTRYRAGFRSGGSQQMFADLFGLVLEHGFSVPPQIGAAFRALGAVEGTLTVISPEMDVVAAAREQGRELMAGKLQFRSLKDEFEQRIVQLMPLLNRMPQRINKISQDLEQGRFSMNVRMLADPSDRSFLTGLFQQLIVAILAGSAVLGSIVLITSDSGPLLTDQIRLYGFFGYVLLFGGFVLGMRALMLVFRWDSQDRERR